MKPCRDSSGGARPQGPAWPAWMALLVTCQVHPAAGLTTSATVGKVAAGTAKFLGGSRANATFLVAHRVPSTSWLQRGTEQTSTRSAETVIVVILLAFAGFGLVGLLALFNHHWSQQAIEQDVKHGFVAVHGVQGIPEYPGSMGALPGDSMRSLATASMPPQFGVPGGASFGYGGPPAPSPQAGPGSAAGLGAGSRSGPFDTAPGGSFGSVPSATAARTRKANACC